MKERQESGACGFMKVMTCVDSDGGREERKGGKEERKGEREGRK